MSLIKKPSELMTSPVKKALLYGQPGMGKTTLALSAPNPVILDFDGGIHRVNGAHQKDCVPVSSWDDIIALMNSNELDSYDTIVVDTVGKMLDYMSAFIMRNDPKMRMRDGSLSLKGYGARKVMFINFLSQCTAKHKNIVCVAHEREDKDGEKRYIRAEIGGSSAGDLIKELDLVGYIKAYGEKRVVCWTGTDEYYGKNACNLPSIMEIPTILDATGSPIADNNFLTNVFLSYDNYLAAQHNLRVSYDALMARINAAIDKVDSLEAANTLWGQFQSIKHIWSSKAAAKIALDTKCSALGFKYNEIDNKYEAA